MTVAETAARLNLSPASVRREIANGNLACCRVGPGRRVIWIGEDHITAYLRGRESGGAGRESGRRAPASPPRVPSVAELKAMWKAEGLLP